MNITSISVALRAMQMTDSLTFGEEDKKKKKKRNDTPQEPAAKTNVSKTKAPPPNPFLPSPHSPYHPDNISNTLADWSGL